MTLNLLVMGRDIASAFSFTLLYIHIRDLGVHKHGTISAFCLMFSLSPFDVSKIDILGSDYEVLALWLHITHGHACLGLSQSPGTGPWVQEVSYLCSEMQEEVQVRLGETGVNRRAPFSCRYKVRGSRQVKVSLR